MVTSLAGSAMGQDWQESPAPMLQWFESPWSSMERKMPDFFLAGYGSAWVPPVSRGYVWPGSSNQNSTSAGYDVFDRFNLGTPSAQTAYGTEQGFDAVVDEFHRCGAQVYIDSVLNHDSSRSGDRGFMDDGGYPGLWLNPPATGNKSATDNWGDFHNGTSSGYYQSEAPQSARYCLLNGDLISLIDIAHESNNSFIRQPAAAGNPLNIPGGRYFNNPNPANTRFYPDLSLGFDPPVNNPGMSYAGPLNTGIFSPPCDVPWRNEPASQFTFGHFNTTNPSAGDPVAENATGYLMRWTQWMMDVHKVDGFRVDAMKHMPSWFFDTFYDSVTHLRRTTPDGRQVNPFVFGECVEGNDFCFDRYVRKPNGRTIGRSAAGDAFSNRDVLDLSGAGSLRNLIGAGGLGDWNSILPSHIDSTDDGYNNGSVGVMHIFSHDNGTTGQGNAVPPTPTYRQQGWYAYAYMLMRTGQTEVFYNAKGISRTGSGFYPKNGLPNALGQDSASTNPDDTITNLVRLSNQLGRGEFQPRWIDADVMIYERATRNGTTVRGNCLVACNDRYDGGYDQRTFNTTFPQGTRLIEMTGNATNATVDPNNDILDVITVGANGSVTIRVPRNVSPTGTEHNKGFVIYAPAIPAGTLTLTNTSGNLPVDAASTPAHRRRLATVPIITSDSFQIQLTTTNGDPGAGNNSNADDNAVFRINEGYDDWNGNGHSDIDYTNAVVPGYEQFVTRREPLADTANTTGNYAQAIDATRLDEGLNYISVVAFRKRDAVEAPLFREFRQVVYIDRLAPQVRAEIQCPLPEGTTSYSFKVRALDRTVTAVHVIRDPANVPNPLTLANALNAAPRLDRFEFQAGLSGLTPGEHTILVIAFEESGRGTYQYITCRVGAPPCFADYNQDGGIDGADVESFFTDWEAGDNNADVNADGGVDGGDVETFFAAWEAGSC
ncbi:MAG: hypothetical protein JSR77_16280 [Planctomycetes bacterium]|nr:hypothetical protein [Planctomycetota bacterium]